MKQLFLLLAITAGILFFQSPVAQAAETEIQQTEQTVEQESSTDNTVNL